jgi:hypothetical protein
MVLATTGLVGFMVLISAVKRIADNLKNSKHLILLSSCFAALLIHSLFSNSLFYPWVMGYFIVLLSVGIKD